MARELSKYSVSPYNWIAPKCEGYAGRLCLIVGKACLLFRYFLKAEH